MVFTIAIPTYNNGETVRKAVLSAVRQNFYLNYEILVVNNCSTDHTAEILEEFSQRIRIITNPQTVSLVDNHNICLKEATGDYILFCHSDDKLLDDALTKIYRMLVVRGFPSRYVLWGRSMFRDFHACWKRTGVHLDQVSAGIDTIKAFLSMGLTPSGTCFSRKSFLETGGFIKTDRTVAPTDMITMWKLVLRRFEMEMTSKIYFIREYASTAQNLSLDDWIEAKTEAVCKFMEACQDSEAEQFRAAINDTRSNSFDTYIAFKKNGLIPKRLLMRNFFIFLAKQPIQIFSFHNFLIFKKILSA